MSVAPFVNLGVFEEYEPSRKLLKLHLVDMKTFTKVAVIQESTLIPNSSPALYGNCDFSTFPNGDIVVMNYPTDTMTLYDKKENTKIHYWRCKCEKSKQRLYGGPSKKGYYCASI